MPVQTERVLCAAVLLKRPERFIHQPSSEGLVLCGHRHPAIIEQLKTLLSAKEWADVRRHSCYLQGFLTSRGRFVIRSEAREVALKAGQVNLQSGELYSEDLY